MNRTYYLCLLSCLLLGSCGLQEREKKLEEGMQMLHQKEQELALKEQTLNDRQKTLDSVESKHTDTLANLYPTLEGNWSVKMICNVATCQGFAIGDTKSEQWEFRIQSNEVMAIAISNNKVTRIYTGNFNGDQLVMNAQLVETQPDLNTRMVVRIRFSDPNNLTGEREIIRQDDCNIIYSLTLKKQVNKP